MDKFGFSHFSIVIVIVLLSITNYNLAVPSPMTTTIDNERHLNNESPLLTIKQHRDEIINNNKGDNYQGPDTIPMDFFVDGSLGMPVNCDDDVEILVHGKELECEQTCSNPRPICRKSFVFDRPFCFCKVGLFRNELTGKCVTWEQCQHQRKRQANKC